MRIGLFGGTFDPPHLAHLILAERCRDGAGLDEVWFMPSYLPPHKQDRPITRFEQRCDMVLLATTGQPAFRLEPIEKELPPPSYTAHTLEELRTRHPDHEFALIVGADSWHDLPGWYEPRRILELARLVVVPRPGSPRPKAAELATAIGVKEDSIRLDLVDSPAIDIASRNIRERVAAGRSIRYLVPRSVEEFIRERRLYVG